jgi:hypothetical protein
MILLLWKCARGKLPRERFALKKGDRDMIDVIAKYLRSWSLVDDRVARTG